MCGRGKVRIIVRLVRRCRPVHYGLAAVVFAFASVLLAACNNLIPDTPKTQSPNLQDQLQSIDLLPRFPQPSGSATANRNNDPRAVIYKESAESADGASAAPPEGAAPAATGDGYDLSFENAPVATVAKVVLGDILGVGYIIDPRAQGTVTLTAPAAAATTVTLFSNSAAASVPVPGLATVPQGQKSVTFPITTIQVPAAVNVTITASVPGP